MKTCSKYFPYTKVVEVKSEWLNNMIKPQEAASLGIHWNLLALILSYYTGLIIITTGQTNYLLLPCSGMGTGSPVEPNPSDSTSKG